MESVTHIVGDLDPAVRETLANLVGHPLQSETRVFISFDPPVNPVPAAANAAADDEAPDLPEWCNVLHDVSEEEYQRLRALILDRTPPRDIDVS